MTDIAVAKSGIVRPGIFSTAALQKAVAFVVLIALLLFFSVFASNFAAWNNMVKDADGGPGDAPSLRR